MVESSKQLAEGEEHNPQQHESHMPKKGLPNWVKTTSAIVISIGILAFYFKDIDWPGFIETIENANWWMAFLAVLIPQLVFWLFSVYQIERTFRWWHRGFDWKNYTWVRGALYLVMMVNTGVGGAGNVLYLQQKTQVSWMKFIAIGFFRASVQSASVGFLLIPLTLLMHVMGVFEKTPLNPWLWWTVLIVGQLAFWDGWYHFLENRSIGLSKYLFTEGEENGQLIGGFRNRDHEIWQVFREASKAQWIYLMIWAQISVITMVLGYWFFAKAFSIEIPFALFVVTIFLVAFLQDLPIAFAGFGSTTMAWSIFYGEYVTPETIASLTLCLPLLRLLCRGAIGVICIKPAISDVTAIISDYRNRKPSQDLTQEASVEP